MYYFSFDYIYAEQLRSAQFILRALHYTNDNRKFLRESGGLTHYTQRMKAKQVSQINFVDRGTMEYGSL